ncbi:MAG: peptidoglycan-binding domain-containing protein [Carnobacterium sp.]
MRHGNDVLQIQLALSSIYFYPNKGAKNNGCDSWYGFDTANAVKRFQLMYGLVADGVYGPATAKKLDSIVNK